MREGSYEIVIDAASRRQHVTRLVRNGACRLPEHEPWVIQTIARGPEDITVAQALALGPKPGAASGASLRLDGMPFVAALTLPRVRAANAPLASGPLNHRARSSLPVLPGPCRGDRYRHPSRISPFVTSRRPSARARCGRWASRQAMSSPCPAADETRFYEIAGGVATGATH